MCVVVRDEPPQTQKKKTTSVRISCWCENFAVNPEKCENSKKMFAFQIGVEIPTPRASLVYKATLYIYIYIYGYIICIMYTYRILTNYMCIYHFPNCPSQSRTSQEESSHFPLENAIGPKSIGFCSVFPMKISHVSRNTMKFAHENCI